jgi:hypothetical protein
MYTLAMGWNDSVTGASNCSKSMPFNNNNKCRFNGIINKTLNLDTTSVKKELNEQFTSLIVIAFSHRLWSYKKADKIRRRCKQIQLTKKEEYWINEKF